MPHLDPYDDARDARQRARHGGAAPGPFRPDQHPDRDRPGGRDPIAPVYAPPGTETGATAEFVLDRPSGPPPAVVPGRPGTPARPGPPAHTGAPARPGPDARAGADVPVHPGRDAPRVGDGRPRGPWSTGPGEADPYRTSPAPAGEDLPEPPRRRVKGRRRATWTGAPAAGNALRQAAYESGDDEPAKGRSLPSAGRNLPAAIGVSLGLGAVLAGSLFLWREGFLLLIAALIVVGVWEMTRALAVGGARPPLIPLTAGGVMMAGLAWFAGPDALALGLLVTVLASMLWRLGDGRSGFLRDAAAATLIAVYVPFLGGFAALLAYPEDGVSRVVVTVVAVVLTDTGGYVAGVFLGKHPMAPSISPKKSWEGFGGSALASALGSALLVYLLLGVAPWWGALFGIGVTISAVLGDLAESMIKRDLGIKDMSNLLPGHGGLMDRLDSILFALPTAFLLLSVLAPGS
ncbi:phosphatidate cytidylyltransferase [Catenuloplanes nepalensis]|uniref:Phosphatidate cytidylyltransferase n=1 Tax=Catenuloplanes nepalensis TaxID=587533 RepID=A0ABT9N0W3_9ACTN|nr:phosphatidate cytidylyltransferase [Catenuloplanes nepalensis]MDP9797133.1 phosphatidate cytidylyltransferase [Catenuloplanes nepalensis]